MATNKHTFLLLYHWQVNKNSMQNLSRKVIHYNVNCEKERIVAHILGFKITDLIELQLLVTIN
jgi:hypothetical protein